MTLKQKVWSWVVAMAVGASLAHAFGAWFVGLAFVVLVINLFAILSDIVSSLINEDDDEEEDEPN